MKKKIAGIVSSLFYLFFVLLTTKANAQGVLLRGTVLDEKNSPVIGVTVIVKSNAQTVAVAQTDTAGMFTLNKLSTGVKYDLSFTCIGYISYTEKEFSLSEKTNTLLIRMKGDPAVLNELVVVGYGKQRKITLTGSVASVETKELKSSAVSNLSNALVGRLPGLIARQSTGATGQDGSKIWLRGQSTYSSSNNPLIMIDGVPRDGFEFIDPNEISNITILKDASATAIYGVRGANGVILVTTRRGEAGKAKIQVNVEQAVKTPMKLPKYLHSADYFRLHKQGLINDGATTEASLYTDDFINRYDQSKNWPDSLEYKYLYPDVDWIHELLKPASMRTVANANISGGTPGLKYFISGSYFHEDGIYKRTGDFPGYNTQDVENRFNFRSNLDVKLSSWLSAELGLATIVRNQVMPDIYQDEFFTLLKKTPPYVMPMTNPNGSISQVAGYTNPYGELAARGFQKPNSFYTQGTVGLTSNLDFITKGLSFRTRFSFDSYNSNGFYRSRKYYTYTYQGNNKYQMVNSGQDFLNYALYNQNYYYNINPEFYLNYNKQVKKHNISGMLLYLITSKSIRSTNATGALPYRQQGLTGRFSYSYDDRYITEFDFGYNGSENFAKGRRFGFFPAVSAAWVLSREKFLSSANNWLDLLKLRVSAGKVGNQDPGTRFAYQSNWNINAKGYNFGSNYDNTMPGAVEATAGNPQVTWETARKYNGGVDLSIKNGLFSFTGDVFYEHRTGIYQSSSPIISGFLGLVTFPKLNGGIVDNHGFEFEIGHRNRLSKDLNYEVKATYSFARNKIIKYLEIPMPDRTWQQVTGTRINSISSYVADGYFQSKEDIAKGPNQSLFGVMQPGDIRYKDLNGDGVINSYDQTYLNKVSEPEQILGVSMSVSFKGIDFSALFQGAFGRYIDVAGPAIFGPQNDFSNILSDWKDNYWTPERPDARYPRLMAIKNVVNTQHSTQWLWKADYVRLKNLEIGYNLPKAWTNPIGLRNIRVYVNGNNLLTWSTLRLFDPEEDNATPNYPLMRTYNAGLSLSFK